MSTSCLALYQQFCASPLRTPTEIEGEFARLSADPDIQYVAFHKPHILMLGTAPLSIEWRGFSFEIGQLIIFFIRKREGRVWETAFRIANVTGTKHEEDQDLADPGCYIHPHVVWTDYDDIAFPTGELCIASGQHAIYQSLRKGQVYRAFTHLWAALNVYGTGKPFAEIWEWPIIVEENDHG